MASRKHIVSLTAAALFFVVGALRTPFATAGIVYTMTNPDGPNAVAMFRQDAKTGLLTLKATFPTGGIGSFDHTACSQDTLVTDGEFLYGVNSASNDVSVFKILSDGNLQLVGKPIPSGGLIPITLAVSRGILYVANQGDGKTVPGNYTGFFVNDGHLQPIPNSTVQLTVGGMPGDLRFTDNGRLLVGSRWGDNVIDTFKVTSSGHLQRIQELTGQEGVFGIQFNPARKGQLIVGLSTLPGSGSYIVRRDGTIKNTGKAVHPEAIDSCWTAIRNDGKFVWLSGFLASSIALHQIDEDGRLTVVGLHDTSPFGQLASDLALDENQHYLYEVIPQTNQIHVMRVTGGTADGGLADIQTVSLPGNGTPEGLVIISSDDDHGGDQE